MAPGAVLVAVSVAFALAPTAPALPAAPPDFGEARSILPEASALVPKIDEPERGTAGANIAGQQARSGDLAGVLATLKSLGEHDLSIAVQCVAYALVGRGEWRVAMTIIADLPASVPRAGPYTAVAGRLAKIGDFDDAQSVAEIIREMPNGVGSYLDAMRVICSEEWKAGNTPAALHTLDEALDVAGHVEKTPDLAGFSIAWWCRALVQDLTVSGYSQAASVVVQRIDVMAAEENDQNRKRQILGLLSPAQARIGDFAAAMESIGRLSPGKQRDSALLSVIGEMARQGDPARARELAAQVSPQSWDNSALEQFAYVLGTSGDQAGALEILDRVQGTGERALGLAQLALQQAEKPDPSSSVTLMLAEEAQRAAGKSGEPFVSELIAVTRAALGNFAGSIEILQGLDDKQRTWPLWNITMWMTEAGKKNEALALAHAQDGPNPRAYALLGTASGLIAAAEAASRKASSSKQ